MNRYRVMNTGPISATGSVVRRDAELTMSTDDAALGMRIGRLTLIEENVPDPNETAAPEAGHDSEFVGGFTMSPPFDQVPEPGPVGTPELAPAPQPEAVDTEEAAQARRGGNGGRRRDQSG